MENNTVDSKRCGYVAILGRSNVGKSTLLNMMLGQKVSITSRKPQTTRHQLLGIKTTDSSQVLYVDTPGIHGNEQRAINRYMNRSARSVIRDVDVIVFVVDRTQWNSDDQLVADSIGETQTKLIVAVNKIDLIKNKQELLPQLSKIQEVVPRAEIIPISATTGENVERMESLVEAALPMSPYYFPDDQITDRSQRFLVAEIIREKLMRQLGDEIPYAVTIQIERFVRKNKTTHIDATIFVEREGQKAILIGSKGEKLKRIGSDARSDIERLLETKVMLTTWVKVKTGWSNDDRALKSLGYDDV
ncbi:MAG: GTPase Era [Gammaproteobacteria bacterium]|nr:GTPase Era [Gammaproteobacteria bacterium]